MLYKFRLTDEQMLKSGAVGLIRQIQSYAGVSRYIDPIPTRWGNAIIGAMAEFAWANCIKQPWTGQKQYAEPDVGTQWEVRYTQHTNGVLIINQDDMDKKNFRYVLAVGGPRDFSFPGWIWLREAPERGVHRKPSDGKLPPARFESYWVPQSSLQALTGPVIDSSTAVLDFMEEKSPATDLPE
jgi:hypothetical protein